MSAHFNGGGHCTTKEYLFGGRRYWVARSRRGFVTRAFSNEQSAINAADDIDEYFEDIARENEVYHRQMLSVEEWFQDQQYLTISESIRHLLGKRQIITECPDTFSTWLVWMEGSQKGFILTDETDAIDSILVDGQWPTPDEASHHASTLSSGRTPRF